MRPEALIERINSTEKAKGGRKESRPRRARLPVEGPSTGSPADHRAESLSRAIAIHRAVSASPVCFIASCLRRKRIILPFPRPGIPLFPAALLDFSSPVVVRTFPRRTTKSARRTRDRNARDSRAKSLPGVFSVNLVTSQKSRDSNATINRPNSHLPLLSLRIIEVISFQPRCDKALLQIICRSNT